VSDAFAPAMFFSVCALCISFLIWDARRRKSTKSDERLDRMVANLQREAVERGKLSKRLAQAETKIMRLHRYIAPQATSGERQDG
jgi:Flp pilus assembly protein TadB